MCIVRKEKKDGVLSGTLLSGREIMPSHQFYLGLAVAPVICFPGAMAFISASL